MLNKLKFNNLVISNKKGIQQSRTQTINKLVHKIRNLKSLLEKHPDNVKCQERIRKSTESIEFLKKLKGIDVMKKILLMDKSASVIITNGLSTPEEIAMALLSMNKTMQCLIKRFKTELQLNEDGNADWKIDLEEPSKRRKKIERTEDKRRKRLETKQQKVIGRKRQEWLENNQHNLGENISHDTVFKSATGVWKIEELSNEYVESSGKHIENEPTEESKTATKEKSFAKITSLEKRKKLDGANITKSKNKKVKLERKSDNEPSAITENFNFPDTCQNDISNDATECTAEPLTVDPFFITESGVNYMSTAVIKTDNFCEEKTHGGKRDPHMIKLNNDKTNVYHRDHKFETRNKNQKHMTIKMTETNNKWSGEREQQNKWIRKRNATENVSQNNLHDKKTPQMRHGPKHAKSAIIGENKLHPSWEAKQKRRPVITGFEGKKIIFDEDISKPSNQGISTKANKFVAPNTNKSEDILHPSWAAKQKLKPTIAPFQGKKITFENDD